MKITKAQLKELIKEEALKIKKEIELKKELTEIDKQLNEVYAGEEMEPGESGIHSGQKKAVFTTKNDNPHLKMEEDEMGDEVEGEMDMNEETVDKEDVKAAIEDLEKTLGVSDEAEDEEEGEEEIDLGDEEIEGEELEIDENLSENLDEPIEGESVAQKTEESKVEDGMAKDTHVKEGVEPISESEEKKRMRLLAGI